MKPFKHWSASQISTFRLCARKWYFGKIMGLEEPESQALEDGKRYASECEVYMKTGSTAGMSSVTRPVAALHGASTFPKATHRNTLVEYPIGLDTRPEGEKTPGVHVTLLEVDGLPGVGFMDVCDIKEDRPVAWDFKSTKAKRWIKTTDELAKDTQMAGVYAPAIVKLHQARYGKDPQLVGVAHVALLKPPEQAEAVVVGPKWLTLDEVAEQWRGVETSVRQMKDVALLPTPDRVTPSWSACSAFGGCPHRDRCQALKQVTTPTQGPNTMTLLERVAAAAQAQGTSTPAAATPASTPGTMSLADKIKAKLATPGQINPPDAANPAADKGVAAAVAAKPAVPAVQQVSTPARNPAVVAAENAEPRRQPRNGTPRLVALGWTEEQVGRMTVNCKHDILDNAVRGEGNTVDEHGDWCAIPVEQDMPPAPAEDEAWAGDKINTNAALELGEKLGWTEEVMNSLADETFRRILTEKLSATEWVINHMGTLTKIAPVVVEEPVAPLPRTRRAANTTQAPAAPVANIEEQLALAEEKKQALVAAEKEHAEREARIASELKKQAQQEAMDKATEPLFLLIDCRPSKGFGDVVELSEYAAPLCAMVCERKKVEHYNLLPYNEGEKMVAALLMINPPSGMVCVDSALPLSKWALEVLAPMAKMIVRGVR